MYDVYPDRVLTASQSRECSANRTGGIPLFDVLIGHLEAVAAQR